LRIELRLYASLRKYLPGETPDGLCRVEVEEGATIRSLFAQIHIPADAPKIVFLNGIHAKGDEVLKEGDRVGAFPPVAGG
jgi:molybdopterin converting factor small subunit